ncbi:hypothetical protein TIFTF001_006611 [Ficus carica]|uniref:Uncharacterized protein n=1 Tax=Ficus carica TaxID=3494 RepID=A0AA88A0U8_FICCA|nr:hypothetical protein TIFTF001_006611 [Ficus carica]
MTESAWWRDGSRLVEEPWVRGGGGGARFEFGWGRLGLNLIWEGGG